MDLQAPELGKAACAAGVGAVEAALAQAGWAAPWHRLPLALLLVQVQVLVHAGPLLLQGCLSALSGPGRLRQLPHSGLREAWRDTCPRAVLGAMAPASAGSAAPLACLCSAGRLAHALGLSDDWAGRDDDGTWSTLRVPQALLGRCAAQACRVLREWNSEQ